MKTIEKSAKTVDDAIEAGLLELKLSLSDVDIDIIEHEKPGLFGMFGRLARVKITEKKRDDDFDFDMPVLSLEKQPAPKPQKAKPAKAEKPEREEKPKQELKPRPEKSEKREEAKPEKVTPEQKKPEKAKPVPKKPEKVDSEPKKPEAVNPDRKKPTPDTTRAPRPPKGQSPTAKGVKPARPKPPVNVVKPAKTVHNDESGEQKAPKPPMPVLSMEDLPPLDMEALSADGKKAYEFLTNTTRLMGVEVEIRMLEKEGQLLIQMIGDTLGILIGRRGETLDALQYLTSLGVNRGRDEYMRVTLDTEHYRAKREEALRRLAERMANRARKTGRRVVLEPMNPYERRILHSELQDNEFVTTHSEGEDPYRRVIITLK